MTGEEEVAGAFSTLRLKVSAEQILSSGGGVLLGI